jgi:hypothetical protein
MIQYKAESTYLYIGRRSFNYFHSLSALSITQRPIATRLGAHYNRSHLARGTEPTIGPKSSLLDLYLSTSSTSLAHPFLSATRCLQGVC